MSTLKVDNIESYTDTLLFPVTIKDGIITFPNASGDYGSHAVTFGTANTGSGDYSFTVGSSNLNQGYASLVSGINNKVYNAGGYGALVGGNLNTLSGTQQYAFVVGYNNTASLSNHVHVGGRSNLANNADYSHIIGRLNRVYSHDYVFVHGYDNLISGSNFNDYQFIVGKQLSSTSTQAEGSFVVGHSGSANLVEFNPNGGANSTIIIDELALPTADPGVAGQLYTTGSDFFGGPAGLKVLMIST